MEDYQTRVVEDKKDLDAKIEQLWGFICGEPDPPRSYITVSADERDRLRRQWAHMSDYSKVLGERIAAF